MSERESLERLQVDLKVTLAEGGSATFYLPILNLVEARLIQLDRQAGLIGARGEYVDCSPGRAQPPTCDRV